MKTKHIAQQLALLITLGAAVSAHAQLLGGRGGAVGGSLGGMIGGSGSMIGGSGSMGAQLSGMGSMAQRGAPTSSGSANGSVSSGSMSRDAMKAQAEGAHADAQPGAAHARGMATISKQAAVNGAGQAGSAIRSVEVRPAANVNASGSFDASGSASN